MSPSLLLFQSLPFSVHPYGVYDLEANSAWVGVGVDHDTASFAVETIRRWWRCMGHPL